MGIGIYCRISQDGEGSGLGVARQEEDCRALAKQRGWRVAQTYIDNDVSAYSGKTRPGYERMLEDIRSGSIDGVVVWHLDRLHRQPRELEAFIDTCKEARLTQVATVTGDLDVGNDDGLFQARILTAVAAKESGDKSRRLRRKHLEMAQSGRSPWGVGTPFGYLYNSDAKAITPHPQQAPIVRELFERYAAGWSLRALLRDLNDRRIVGQRGRTRWANTAGLCRILDNPTYAGYRHYNGEQTEGSWKPIVDRQLFETVHQLRTASKAPRPALNRQGKGRAVLSGLLLCRCGAPMYRSSVRNDKRSTYECSRSAKRHQGDCRAGGLAAIRAEHVVATAFLTRIAEPYRRHVETNPPRTKPATIPSELHKLDAQIERIADALVDAPPTLAASLKKKARALEEQRQGVLLRMAQDQVRPQLEAQQREALEELRKLADLPHVWDLATAEERNEMLRVAIERVRVLPGRQRLKELAIEWLAS
jgi:DNA invertase Pin-like site-specific DNA recombinase